MKNQYFGDINDYKKYGLLRILANQETMRLAICWMLTSADHRNDGQFISYLQEPGRWRHIDPPLFDSLEEALQTPETRDIQWMKTANLLPSANFFSPILTDSGSARRDYFGQFRSFAADHGIVFFDPDNGLEVKSKPYGRKDSSKFLYWEELAQTFRDGHSILVYQHFPRIERSAFLQSTNLEIGTRLRAPESIVFRTANVAFILIPQPRHLDYFHAQATQVEHTWGQHIEVTVYTGLSNLA